MSKSCRCSRCFAPKDRPEEVCMFCGHDPVKEKCIAETAMEYVDLMFCDDPIPDGVSLEDRIEILRVRHKG